MNIKMEDDKKRRVNYWVVAFFYGLVCATLPIIATEIIWDEIANRISDPGLTRSILEAFFRAALLEESFKFFGFFLAYKKYRFMTGREYMLAAGTIGLVYAIVEKVVTLNPINIVLGIVFPMHVLWQANQGRHFYAYRVALENGKKKYVKTSPVIHAYTSGGTKHYTNAKSIKVKKKTATDLKAPLTNPNF